ncbi:MAG: hypothetical protein PVG89_17715 [Gammaproteobacteria bacterium]|jgi:hypothetical protein
MCHIVEIILIVLLTSSTAIAGDFNWLKELNIRATSNSVDFKATLATRFKIGDAEINAVFSNVDRPADAYMVLRLGELSRHSTSDVVEQYRANRNRGWGALAKSLGIKPGSREFHALKAGHDLRMADGNHHRSTQHTDKRGNKGKSTNRHKPNGKHR